MAITTMLYAVLTSNGYEVVAVLFMFARCLAGLLIYHADLFQFKNVMLAIGAPEFLYDSPDERASRSSFLSIAFLAVRYEVPVDSRYLFNGEVMDEGSRVLS